MNIALWTVQVLGGAFFIVSGAGKAFCFNPAMWERATQQVPWAAAVPRGLFIVIGGCEFLGGLGLVLPGITRLKPTLTPVAAGGLTVVMTLASGFHLLRGEYALMSLTLVLCAVAAFVAYERFAVRPIEPKAVTPKAILTGLAGLAVALLLVFTTLPKGWSN